MFQSLSTLTSLVQEISRAENAIAAMHQIVIKLTEIFEVPVCSLYLKSASQQRLVLAATEGLAPDSVGRVSLALNEGLVGKIGRTLHPLNLADAPTHDKFVYIPETHEAPYHQFMGVPLIHLRELIGVLVIQGTVQEKFSREAEAFMVTIASQLAGTLQSIQRSGDWLPQGPTAFEHNRHAGVRAAPGIACGHLEVLHLNLSLQDITEERSTDAEAELARFDTAVERLEEELTLGASRLGDNLPSDVSNLFAVYLMMLQSPELRDAVVRHIRLGSTAPWALRESSRELAAHFDNAEDPYIRARGEDIRNIGNRLLRHMLSKKPLGNGNERRDLLLAGDLISIADLSVYHPEQIKGIICTGGSALSHTGIVANALGIPAVMGVTGLDLKNHDGQLAIIDGYRGECITTPSDAMINEYRRLQSADEQFIDQLASLRDLPAETLDGVRVQLLTNTGLLADVTPGRKNGAEGVGLYRSEIPFMLHESFPTEDEQYEVYRQVLDAYAPLPVSMRTLDIGGDKQLPYFEIREENPFLGWRGIRFTLDNTSLLVTQLRAMLRANAEIGNLRLLIPMVSRVDELQTFMHIVEDTLEELASEDCPVARPPIGMMVEVPSALLLLPRMLPLVDFVSIGSNDLTQYLLAVDRNNPKVAALFDNLNPAMLVALEQIVSHCEASGTPLSLCGEMAADPAAVLLLVGLGLRTLSLSAHSIPKIKWLIRSIESSSARNLLQRALQFNNEAEIRELLGAELRRLGLKNLTGPEPG
ncbi:phosphoenolpyruvate-protein phosphotransferase PtsP [Marinobacterium nitratireducens]|uniref:phosphoenolpyruvate--protein phosphotransferase n=1 Tax=Marinobacterium nitratireducens TaxID=518897 RepID=A0A918DRK2_9GAMM|nr:phosphoenolpyruvate--protein phosphotransferase [Marinobacterium nitratireducens]GGO81222.1 phosphoenolpyruvate-protein phosphotransferase PtsP [Marinobacterium nitratireducens]